MRVRPFFWGVLICACLGALLLAAIVPRQVPARLSVQLVQAPRLDTPTTFLVEVTDVEGVMVNNAQIASRAWMTNMPMLTKHISTSPKGQGLYLVRINWPMVGPWMVSISMKADGFASLQHTLQVRVSPDTPPTSMRSFPDRPPAYVSHGCSMIPL